MRCVKEKKKNINEDINKEVARNILELGDVSKLTLGNGLKTTESHNGTVKPSWH